MYQEIIDTYTAQAEKFIAPIQELARLSLSNSEKMYSLQLEILQSYVDLGVEQLKAVTEINNPESLQAFMINQVDVAKSISQKLVADGQAVAEIGNEFNTGAQRLARESLNAMIPQVA